MTSASLPRPRLTASPPRLLAEALSGVLRALITTPVARLYRDRPSPSSHRAVPSVVAAGRSMRIVNNHHVDFPRFAGEMPL